MIRQYKHDELEAHISTFVNLLINVVDYGASIGFLPPLQDVDALAYWQARVAAIAAGDTLLFVAHKNGTVTGCVQLALEHRANGNHRAEVQKLMVHPDYRRKGIARGLMFAAEQEARVLKRTTLVLDTRAGDASEKLYQSMNYVQAGVIPQYARSADGSLHSTVFYYKLLD